MVYPFTDQDGIRDRDRYGCGSTRSNERSPARSRSPLRVAYAGPRAGLAAFILFAFAATPAAAHELGQSYIFLRIYDHAVEVRLEMTADDLRSVIGADWPDERVSLEQIEPHIEEILAYAFPRFRMWAGGKELALRYVDFDRLRVREGDFVQLHFVIDDVAAISDALDVEYTVFFEVRSTHRNMLVIEHNWKTTTFNNEGNVSLIFSPSEPRQTLHLEQATVLTGLLGFVRLGAWHIWIGLDHILFLVALALPSVLYRDEKGWRPVADFRKGLFNILLIVTSFTVAHSITLSLAALQIVVLPSRLVESVIAASIVVAALHNVYPRYHGREWAFAFVFGLFHGFGFATVLSDLGLEPRYLVLSLLGFNVGVEAGQVLIIAALFPLLFVIRAREWYSRTVITVGSLMLAAVAFIWLAERALDVPLYRYAMAAPQILQRYLGSL